MECTAKDPVGFKQWSLRSDTELNFHQAPFVFEHIIPWSSESSWIDWFPVLSSFEANIANRNFRRVRRQFRSSLQSTYWNLSSSSPRTTFLCCAQSGKSFCFTTSQPKPMKSSSEPQKKRRESMCFSSSRCNDVASWSPIESDWNTYICIYIYIIIEINLYWWCCGAGSCFRLF